MKILSLSLDKRILDRNSDNFQRQKMYSQLVDELYVVIFSKEAKHFKSDNLFIYGSGGENKLSRLLKTYKKAKAILKESKEKDWVITAQDPFETALIGWCLSKKFKVGLNIQEHGDYFSEKYWRDESLLNFFRYYLGKILIKRADSIRVVSQRIEDTLISKFGLAENKIVVVPVYTEIRKNTSLNLKLKEKYKGKFVFLTLARMVKQKNLSLLIKAFKGVVSQNSQAVLLIVGQGPEKNKLINLVRKLKLEDKILFIDWTDDIDSYYNLADVYVLSSNYEGWGRVIIEAAGYGLPIIMTNVGCAGEAIKNTESGLIVPLADKKGLEKAMLKLISDRNLRINLGQKAKGAILELPDKRETLKLYQESWQKALKKKL